MIRASLFMGTCSLMALICTKKTHQPLCRYTPSVALCALALVLFALGLIGHIWLLRKYRTWYFSTIVIGTIFEIVGYIARTFSSKKDPYSVIYFVIQYFFIVTAPVRIYLPFKVVLTVFRCSIRRPFILSSQLWEIESAIIFPYLRRSSFGYSLYATPLQLSSRSWAPVSWGRRIPIERIQTYPITSYWQD